MHVGRAQTIEQTVEQFVQFDEFNVGRTGLFKQIFETLSRRHVLFRFEYVALFVDYAAVYVLFEALLF